MENFTKLKEELLKQEVVLLEQLNAMVNILTNAKELVAVDAQLDLLESLEGHSISRAQAKQKRLYKSITRETISPEEDIRIKAQLRLLTEIITPA